VLVVAAAGNRAGMAGADTIWPATMTDVAAVGATTEFKSHFSPRKLWVDFTADGVDVVSDYLTGKVEMSDGGVVSFAGAARWTGTSFAAATVSGAVAAQLSRMRDAGKEAGKKATARDALQAVADAPGRAVARYVHVPSG
jgi:subtilisin family serine protease